MSPIFLRGDSIFIPALFVAYTGQVLDEKTPLHRATSSMSNECKKLFGLIHEL
jgi:glutamine synthetase